MLRISAGSVLKSKLGLLSSQTSSAYATCTSPRVAVVLSGCGVNDGSEIHEAVSVLSHITRNKAVPVAFAPDIKQFHVINHQTGAVDGTHSRYILHESARITRCPVRDICELVDNVDCFDALVFPGGFGVAKNLSDFAFKGCECTVIPEVAEIIEKFHKAGKPQAFACISPVLAARVLCNVAITLGQNSCDKWPYRAAIDDARKMGATVEPRDVDEVCYDDSHRVFSTPAYMYDGLYHEIDDGIGYMIKLMLVMLSKGDLKTKKKGASRDCKN